MNDISPLEFVRSHVLNALQEAKNAAQTGHFDSAQEKLDEAEGTAGEIAEFKELVEQSAKEVADLRSAWVEERLSLAARLLESPKDFNEGQIEVLLVEIEHVDPNNTKAQELKEELPGKARDFEERRVYKKTRLECEKLWAKEKELYEANAIPDVILRECFEPAVKLTEEAVGNYPKYSLLQGLANEAKIKHNESRERYQVWTTAAHVGRFKIVLEELEGKPDKESFRLWDQDGNDLGKMLVKEAKEVWARMAEEYAHTKALNYLGKAKEHIVDHNPRAARNVLDRRNDLFLLSTPDRNLLKDYLKEKVEPAEINLENAETLLQRARKITNREQCWELIEQAVGLWPWVPGVEDARRALLPGLLKQGENLLSDGRRLLTGELDQAKEKAEQSNRLAKLVEDHGKRLGNDEVSAQGKTLLEETQTLLIDIQKEKGLRKELNEAAEELERLLRDNPKAAVARWQELEKENPLETLQRVSSLQRFGKRVLQAGGLTADMDRWVLAMESGEKERIKQAVEECEVALSGSEKGAFREEIETRMKELVGRLEYMTGLEVLSARGNANEALRYFTHVADMDGHPDQTDAKKQAQKIHTDQQREKAINDALDKSSKLLNNAPRQAYETLQAVRDQSSLKRGEVEQLMDKARETWREKLVKTIEAELHKSRLDSDKLRSLAREIREALPEPRPVDYADRAIAAAAEQEAQELENSQAWEEAANKWQEAIQYQRLNEKYRTSWRLARKRATEIEIDRLTDKERARELFDRLEVDLPWDPEVLEWRALFFLRLAERAGSGEAQQRFFPGVHEALRRCHTVIERLMEDGAVPTIQGISRIRDRLTDLKKKLAELEYLATRKVVIERKLVLERSREDFEDAQQEAKQLLSENKHDASLATWWETIKGETLKELAEKDQRLNDDQPWERLDLRSKVLVLDPRHSLARRLLSQLPNWSTRISNQIANTVGDRFGIMVHVSSDAEVLDLQTRLASDLRERARATYDMLQRFSSQISETMVPSLTNILRQDVEQLDIFLHSLEDLRLLVAQAERYLAAGRVNGNWSNFDKAKNEISKKGFGQHRKVIALGDERETLEAKRKLLIEKYETLRECIENNRYDESQRLIQELESDPESGDPSDDFGFRVSFQIKISTDKGKITWRLLKTWINEHIALIDHVSEWLIESGAYKLVQEYRPEAVITQTDAPLSTVRLKVIQPGIEELEDCGNFKKALQDVREAIQGREGDWFSSDKRILAIRPAHQRLSFPPISLAQEGLPQLAKDLLTAADEYLKKLGGEAENLEKLSEELAKKKTLLTEKEKELDREFHEFQEEYKKRRIFPKRSRVLKQKREKVMRALQDCLEIAPNHPSLRGWRKLHILRKDD